MSLQFSIDNILGGKMNEASAITDPIPTTQMTTSSSIVPYMRASLTAAAAAAAANYPSSGLAACYSYIYPYVASSPGMYTGSGMFYQVFTNCLLFSYEIYSLTLYGVF